MSGAGSSSSSQYYGHNHNYGGASTFQPWPRACSVLEPQIYPASAPMLSTSAPSGQPSGYQQHHYASQRCGGVSINVRGGTMGRLHGSVLGATRRQSHLNDEQAFKTYLESQNRQTFDQF